MPVAGPDGSPVFTLTTLQGECCVCTVEMKKAKAQTAKVSPRGFAESQGRAETEAQDCLCRKNTDSGAGYLQTDFPIISYCLNKTNSHNQQ